MFHWIEKLWTNSRNRPDESVDWKTENSLFQFLSQHVNAEGKLASPYIDLPDEKQKENSIRFAPGLRDALFGEDDSNDAKLRIKKLTKLLKTIAKHDTCTAKSEFYAEITSTDAVVGIIDTLFAKLQGLPVLPYLFPFAKDLALKSQHRNAVKFGIALLGRCQDRSILDELKIFGLHDEFTVFAMIAIMQLSDGYVHDLWELAKKVDGWGRIQIVTRLADEELTEEMRDWLVYDGYKNCIMHGYLAHPCAVQGRLHLRLAAGTIDYGLFQSTGEIIEALIEGGPAEDMSDYEHAATVVANYIRHAKIHASELSDFLALHQINDFFMEELESDFSKHEKNGWTKDIIETCKQNISPLLAKEDWQAKTMVALEGEEILYWQGKAAAQKLGIDIWEIVWKKLMANPLEDMRWYDVTANAKEHHVDQIIDFALKTLPLDEIASGPKDFLGFGKGYKPHLCLGWVLNFLENKPGKGEKLILAGLWSPVVQQRNAALNVLEQWGKEYWTPAIKQRLGDLQPIEPNEQTKETIDKLLQ